MLNTFTEYTPRFMVWKSWHIIPIEVEDVFLVRSLRPFLRAVVWPEPSAKAFFLRYIDETGPHIRFRLKGKPEWIAEIGAPQFLEYLGGKGQITEHTYMPEPERFGGQETLILAEEHFHLSTRVAMTRMSRVPYIYGDAMFDAIRMHAMSVHAAGLSADEAKSLFRTLRDSWAFTFIRDEDGNRLTQEHLAGLLETFQEQLEPQREQLGASISEAWYYLNQGLFDKTQTEWEGWHKGNKLIYRHLGQHASTALPQLIHLHNNRMGVANYDEVYLCHILAESL